MPRMPKWSGKGRVDPPYPELEVPDVPRVLPARPDIVAIIDEKLRFLRGRRDVKLGEFEDALLELRHVANYGGLES